MDIWYRRKSTDALITPFWTDWYRSVMEQTSNVFQGEVNRFETFIGIPENPSTATINGGEDMILSLGGGHHSVFVISQNTNKSCDRIQLPSFDIDGRSDVVGDNQDGTLIWIFNRGETIYFKFGGTVGNNSLKALRLYRNLALPDDSIACFRYSAVDDRYHLMYHSRDGVLLWDDPAIFPNPNWSGELWMRSSQLGMMHIDGYITFNAGGTISNDDILVDFFAGTTSGNAFEQATVYGALGYSNNIANPSYFFTGGLFTAFLYDATAGTHAIPKPCMYNNEVISLGEVRSRIVYKDINPFTYAAGDKMVFNFTIPSHNGFATGNGQAIRSLEADI